MISIRIESLEFFFNEIEVESQNLRFSSNCK